MRRSSSTGSAQGDRKGCDESWRPEHRLRRRPDYLRCYRQGRRYDSVGLSLYVTRGESSGPRFGITASRKVGRAVVRQRTRRRVREILRRWPERSDLPPLDVVVHLQPPSAVLPFGELRASLEQALDRARRTGAERKGSARGSRGRSRRAGRRRGDRG